MNFCLFLSYCNCADGYDKTKFTLFMVTSSMVVAMSYLNSAVGLTEL